MHVAVVALVLVPAVLAAQGRGDVEFTLLGGAVSNGAVASNLSSSAGEGDLQVAGGLAYGAALGYTWNARTWAEVTFLRQDTRLEFVLDPTVAQFSPMSENFIHAGARQEFRAGVLTPFLGAGLGVTIFAIDRPSAGNTTAFSLSAQGGGRIALVGQRLSLRGTVRGWFSFVSAGTYGSWCGLYGCVTLDEGRTVTQVEGSLGFRFVF
jgi:hypothetical protein